VIEVDIRIGVAKLREVATGRAGIAADLTIIIGVDGLIRSLEDAVIAGRRALFDRGSDRRRRVHRSVVDGRIREPAGRRAGEIRLDIDVKVIRDVAGEDQAHTADQKVRPRLRRIVSPEIHAFIEGPGLENVRVAHLRIAADADPVIPVLQRRARIRRRTALVTARRAGGKGRRGARTCRRARVEQSAQAWRAAMNFRRMGGAARIADLARVTARRSGADQALAGASRADSCALTRNLRLELLQSRLQRGDVIVRASHSRRRWRDEAEGGNRERGVSNLTFHCPNLQKEPGKQVVVRPLLAAASRFFVNHRRQKTGAA